MAQDSLSRLSRFYTLSYTWYALFGAATTFIVGMAVSIVFSEFLFISCFYK